MLFRSPARWNRMAGAKKKKLIRQSVLIKAAFAYHMPENTLRDEYLKAFGMIADKDPLSFAKELSLDGDELDYIIDDKVRSAEVMKEIKREEKEQEKREKAAQKAAEKAKKAQKPVRVIDLTKAAETEKPDLKEPAKSSESIESETLKSADESEKIEKTEKPSEKKPSETQSTLFSF